MPRIHLRGMADGIRVWLAIMLVFAVVVALAVPMAVFGFDPYRTAE